MTDAEKTVCILIAAAFGWLYYDKHKAVSDQSYVAAGAVSDTVPFYLNYNTTPPLTGAFMETVIPLASGIENSSAPQNDALALFGATLGSSY